MFPRRVLALCVGPGCLSPKMGRGVGGRGRGVSAAALVEKVLPFLVLLAAVIRRTGFSNNVSPKLVPFFVRRSSQAGTTGSMLSTMTSTRRVADAVATGRVAGMLRSLPDCTHARRLSRPLGGSYYGCTEVPYFEKSIYFGHLSKQSFQNLYRLLNFSKFQNQHC